MEEACKFYRQIEKLITPQGLSLLMSLPTSHNGKSKSTLKIHCTMSETRLRFNSKKVFNAVAVTPDRLEFAIGAPFLMACRRQWEIHWEDLYLTHHEIVSTGRYLSISNMKGSKLSAIHDGATASALHLCGLPVNVPIRGNGVTFTCASAGPDHPKY